MAHRDYGDVLRGAWEDYLILETAASRIWAYEAQRIPGLLQTPAYARALAEADPALDDDAARDRAVEAVIARQRTILGEQRPDIRLVIGQAALHQQVGSAEVMNDQLRRLAEVAADSGNVTLQVLAFESGAHAAAGDGALAILQFADTAGLGIVHLGGIAGGVCLESRSDLAAYSEAFDQLRASADTPAQSALLLRDLAGF